MAVAVFLYLLSRYSWCTNLWGSYYLLLHCMNSISLLAAGTRRLIPLRERWCLLVECAVDPNIRVSPAYGSATGINAVEVEKDIKMKIVFPSNSSNGKIS